MISNLTAQLQTLARQLTEAHQNGDIELQEELQDKIWEIEDQIERESEDEYGGHDSDYR